MVEEGTFAAVPTGAEVDVVDVEELVVEPPEDAADVVDVVDGLDMVDVVDVVDEVAVFDVAAVDDVVVVAVVRCSGLAAWAAAPMDSAATGVSMAAITPPRRRARERATPAGCLALAWCTDCMRSSLRTCQPEDLPKPQGCPCMLVAPAAGLIGAQVLRLEAAQRGR
jgi:hypothetical protein